jgi:MscS family membrane protein
LDSLSHAGNGSLPVLSLHTLLIVAGIVVVALVARKVFQVLLLGRLRKLAERTESDVDDAVLRAVDRPIGLLILLAGIHVALSYVRLPLEPLDLRRFSRLLLLLLVTVDITWLFIRLTDVLVVFLQRAAKKTDSALDDQLIPLIRKSIKVAFVILGFVLVVQNLGYKVTGLLAGLGIGGLAIALAAQSTLANIFGSVTILLDRPFRVGDLVKGDGFFGTVEEVGLRSTRIRQLSRTVVTVPNSVLANLTIENWSLLDSRRAEFTLGLSPETGADRMGKAVGRIRAILEARPEVDGKSIVVRFTDVGENALRIRVIFTTPTVEYGAFLRLREEVNLEILRALEETGVEMATTARTLVLRQEKGKPGEKPPA